MRFQELEGKACICALCKTIPWPHVNCACIFRLSGARVLSINGAHPYESVDSNPFITGGYQGLGTRQNRFVILIYVLQVTNQHFSYFSSYQRVTTGRNYTIGSFAQQSLPIIDEATLTVLPVNKPHPETFTVRALPVIDLVLVFTGTFHRSLKLHGLIQLRSDGLIRNLFERITVSLVQRRAVQMHISLEKSLYPAQIQTSPLPDSNNLNFPNQNLHEANTLDVNLLILPADVPDEKAYISQTCSSRSEKETLWQPG